MTKLFITLFCLQSIFVSAQSDAAKQLQMDIQKLAVLKANLNEMYKGYNVLAQGYENIKNINVSNFNLHKNFLDGLLLVSPVVKQYKKVADIISEQQQLVSEYTTASKILRSSGYMNADELNYMSNVYNKLFAQSLKNLDELTTILTDGSVRMTDAERLQSIDKIHSDIMDKLSFLKQFDQTNTLLAVQRAKEHNDIATLQSLYGIK